mmetsp:Transcript_26764/g.92965  ORF Transcript_26764/g.92965 Transcript_26764/m.92965 type:complete len:639 (+) Transcript_26764:657-2573(+)
MLLRRPSGARARLVTVYLHTTTSPSPSPPPAAARRQRLLVLVRIVVFVVRVELLLIARGSAARHAARRLLLARLASLGEEVGDGADARVPQREGLGDGEGGGVQRVLEDVVRRDADEQAVLLGHGEGRVRHLLAQCGVKVLGLGARPAGDAPQAAADDALGARQHVGGEHEDHDGDEEQEHRQHVRLRHALRPVQRHVRGREALRGVHLRELDLARAEDARVAELPGRKGHVQHRCVPKHRRGMVAELGAERGRRAVEAQEQDLVRPVGHDERRAGHDVQQRHARREEHRREHRVHHLRVPDAEVELGPEVELVEAPLRGGLRAAPPPARREEAPQGRKVRRHDVEDHGEDDGGADGGVPLGLEVGVARAAGAREVELWDVGVDDEHDERGVDEEDEEEARREGHLQLGNGVVVLEARQLLHHDVQHEVDAHERHRRERRQHQRQRLLREPRLAARVLQGHLRRHALAVAVQGRRRARRVVNDAVDARLVAAALARELLPPRRPHEEEEGDDDDGRRHDGGQHLAQLPLAVRRVQVLPEHRRRLGRAVDLEAVALEMLEARLAQVGAPAARVHALAVEAAVLGLERHEGHHRVLAAAHLVALRRQALDLLAQGRALALELLGALADRVGPPDLLLDLL